jgi:hypothetical protein
MAGRPTDYKEEYAEQAEKACATFGAKDKELAEYFEVCEKTLNNWKIEHPLFLQSIKRGKDVYDTNKVEASLLERALGYEHPETKVFMHEGKVIKVDDLVKHYPPETAAAAFWLKNRNPKRWRDLKAVEVTPGGETGGKWIVEARIVNKPDGE